MEAQASSVHYNRFLFLSVLCELSDNIKSILTAFATVLLQFFIFIFIACLAEKSFISHSNFFSNRENMSIIVDVLIGCDSPIRICIWIRILIIKFQATQSKKCGTFPTFRAWMPTKSLGRHLLPSKIECLSENNAECFVNFPRYQIGFSILLR